jgi:hypothetical protein
VSTYDVPVELTSVSAVGWILKTGNAGTRRVQSLWATGFEESTCHELEVSELVSEILLALIFQRLLV